MKRCARCHEEKDERDFGRDGGRKDGLCIYCKPCRTARYVKELDEGRIIRDGKLVRKPPTTATCEHCKQEYRPRIGRQRYCSKVCARRARPWVPQPDRKRSGNRMLGVTNICTICGREFHPWRPDQQYCSRACKAEETVGTRYTTSQGYVLVKVRVGTPGAFANNWMPEHRLVLQEQLGRALSPQESVHHINGNKADNRPENLQVRHGKHGSHVRYRCLECGSQNVEPMEL